MKTIPFSAVWTATPSGSKDCCDPVSCSSLFLQASLAPSACRCTRPCGAQGCSPSLLESTSGAVRALHQVVNLAERQLPSRVVVFLDGRLQPLRCSRSRWPFSLRPELFPAAAQLTLAKLAGCPVGNAPPAGSCGSPG